MIKTIQVISYDKDLEFFIENLKCRIFKDETKVYLNWKKITEKMIMDCDTKVEE